ncbi:MAG: hypothetical protein HZA54_02990 [Planctomycetes bacterium]|nr:hypothetical protein [Planctomycetota bacterium]
MPTTARDHVESMPLAAEAVYTILHPDHLHGLAATGKPATLRVRKRWVKAHENFLKARAAGLDVAVLYADAANDCSKLLYWGKVTELNIDAHGSAYTVSELRPIRGRRTQELVLSGTGARIAEGYLRDYAVILTPGFIESPAAKILAAANEPITLFSFGYHGCGGATPALTRAVAAAEVLRGFRPPLWVDIRINRSVRAAGFRDDAFHRLLGDNYRWIPDLGNLAIQDGTDGIRIKKPAAATDLLDSALDDTARRVIFFCHCEIPRSCHRHEVAKLLVRAAHTRAASVRVVEWPGGDPISISWEVTLAVFRKIANGSLRRIRIEDASRLAEAAALPWGSTVDLVCDGESQQQPVGPARFDQEGAYLPILDEDDATRGALQEGGYTAVRA